MRIAVSPVNAARCVYQADEGVDNVAPVNHGLPGIGVASREMALQVACVDSRDLVGEGRHRDQRVVSACEAQEDDQHITPLSRIAASASAFALG